MFVGAEKRVEGGGVYIVYRGNVVEMGCNIVIIKQISLEIGYI